MEGEDKDKSEDEGEDGGGKRMNEDKGEAGEEENKANDENWKKRRMKTRTNMDKKRKIQGVKRGGKYIRWDQRKRG